ncbi:MAG: pyruvate kinase [Candidatus Riflebacteria bacterium]|nr:pyruvate kinase [Candidatus Riflebacteria bacterium]
MRKTKIIVTLGPSAEEPEVLRMLLNAGMNVARLNFSHGDFEEHGRRITRIKALRESSGSPLALMLDTKGPEIRTGEVENDSILLENGKTIRLTGRKVTGTSEVLTIQFEKLAETVTPGSTILLDDGLIMLEVEKILPENEVQCIIKNGGKIKGKRGVNIPGFTLNLPNPTPKDVRDIQFAAEHKFDFIAVSFTESVETIEKVREILVSSGSPKTKIIAKIENHTALKNFDQILSVADGIMVARGDLGVELQPEDVPVAQKELTKKCYMAGKPAITATQMLHTMVEAPRPTRAEVSDVANAVYDSTSAVMLSGETSIGKHPIGCVEMMARIVERAEEAIDYRKGYFSNLNWADTSGSTTSAVTAAAITTAYQVGAKAVITVTESGETARQLSRLRPTFPIIAIVSDEQIYHQLSINWGIQPVLAPKFRTLEELHLESVKFAEISGYVKPGDTVVIVAGVPVGKTGATNMIKVEIFGKTLKDTKKDQEAYHVQ